MRLPEEPRSTRPEAVRAERHLEAMLRSTESLQPLTDPDSVARLAAQLGAGLIPGIQCAVVVQDPDDPAVLRVAGSSGPAFDELVGTAMELEGSLAERALRTRRPVETNDAPRHSPIAARLDNAPPTARLVPLVVTEVGGGSAILGVIGFYRDSADGFARDERRVLDEFALRVAAALHRALLLEAATKTARRLRTGMDVALDLGASLDPAQVVERLLERSLDAVRGDSVALLRVAGDTAVVEGSHDRSGQSWPKGARLRTDLAQLHGALETRRPSMRPWDADAVPRTLRTHLHGVLHTVTVPIVLHGEAYAVLVVSRRRDEPFTADDVAVLAELSPVAGLTLSNARLFGEIDAARVHAAKLADRLALGVETAMDLGSELEPRRVIRRLIERITETVGAERSSFGRVEGDAVVIEDSVAHGSEPLPIGMRFPVDSIGLLRTAVREGIPAQTGRDGALRAAGPLMRSLEHLLIVPLLSQGRTVAIFSVGRMRAEPFDEDALAVLQQVGSIAVLALRNARLFEARRDFMNMAAHELRTPLTVLNGYLSMLRDGTFGPPSQRWVQPIDLMAGKVGELSRLVDDLLIGARIERGVVRADAEPVDLAALAADAVLRAAPRAALLGGHITFEGPEAPILLLVDAANVGKILDNLINNALTYTLGQPRVEVSASREGDVARVLVADHGRGIPADLHERVFEQFFRIEDRELGYPLGTGLGLYISRQLAELHDGRLFILRSTPGDGSVFALELPA